MAIYDNIQSGVVLKIKKKDALCIFIKNPQHRIQNYWLQPDITPQQAVQFYSALIRDLIQDAHLSNSFDLFLFHPHPDKYKMKAMLGDSFEIISLPDDSKIRRIQFAFQTAFEKKYPKVIVLCSDVADINHIFIQDAFQQLDNHDVIVGPSSSRHFYLIGMKRLEKKLFHISTDEPLEELSENFKKLELDYKFLKELPIIDFPVDLQQIWTRINALPGALQSHRFKHTYSVCQQLFNSV